MGALTATLGPTLGPLARAITDAIGGFSPVTLFSSGEQGAWYDPSDFSTLHQDSAGTTPVTAVEQPVGLLLDKRLGLVRGQELIVNGDFSAGNTGWTLAGGTVIAGGAAVFDGVTSQAVGVDLVTNSTPSVAGKTYELVYTITGNTTNPISIMCGNAAGTAVSAAGTYRTILTALDATGFCIRCRASAGIRTGGVDNISVRELPGNHASQATAAARPVLSARKNLLTKTEQFDDAVWTKTEVTATASGAYWAIVPSTTGGVSHKITHAPVASIGSATHSAVVKANGYSKVALKESGTSGVYASFDLVAGTVQETTADGATITALGGDEFLLTMRKAGVVGSQGFQLHINPPGYTTGDPSNAFFAGDGTSGILARYPQMELGPTATRYQRVNTATDYDAAGFPHYELFDRVDDSLAATTGGGGTTGVLLTAAIRAGGSGTARTIWSDTGANTGYKLTLNTSNQLVLSAGNGAAYTSVTGPTITEGTDYVVQAWHDGVNLNVRSGLAAATSAAFATTTAGTAGFTIGKDNGAASGFYGGRIYGLIYVKNESGTAADRDSATRYLANKAEVSL